MKTAIFFISAILFWQNTHATGFSTSSGSSKVLSSRVSQIVDYNETAVEEVLEDPRCPADRLMDTAKCICFMASMKGIFTANDDRLCKEAFGKDPSQLNACSSFTNNGILNKEEATKNAQEVVKDCISGRFDILNFSTAAVRMFSMRHNSIRPFFIPPIAWGIAILLVLTTERLNDYEPMFPTPSPSPSPSDAIRMLTQEFVKNFSPKTAKLLAYNS